MRQHYRYIQGFLLSPLSCRGLQPHPMIPAAPFSLLFLLLITLPAIAQLLSVGLLLRGLWWWSRWRKHSTEQRPHFWNIPTIALAALTAISQLGSGVLLYVIWDAQQSSEQAHYYRQSRERFVLPRDFQYGSVLIPQGSLINRYGADAGDPATPLGLHGLDAVRFPTAQRVGHVWATAIQTMPPVMELASDQRLGPVYHWDAQAADGEGAWVPDPQRPYLECKKGDLASFHAPSTSSTDSPVDVSAPPLDGPQADFHPGNWHIKRCQSDKGPLRMHPVDADLTPPRGASGPIWAPSSVTAQ